MIKIHNVEFIRSCAQVGQCPTEQIPEIAIVGRSNVGKSSLFNLLVQRKKMAKVSGTPGKTRLLNFFKITLSDPKRTPFYLVDLPGYGYAKVSKSEQAGWGKMIENYLLGRSLLKVLIILVDIRRELGPLDRQLLSWAGANGIACFIVATKSDQIPRGKRKPVLDRIRKDLGTQPGLDPEVTPFSAKKGEGREELLKRLEKYL